MNPAFPHLFEPLTIRGKTFKNRILLAPKGYPLRDKDCMTQDALDFYERIARGGAARIVTGECDVQYGSAVFGTWNMFLDPLPETLKSSVSQYAANCHKYDALAFMHFGHMGAYCRDGEYIKQMKKTGRVADFNPPPLPVPTDPSGQKYAPVKPYGPSELVIDEPWDGVTAGPVYDINDGKHVDEMTPQTMDEIADAFARCARNAKRCGLDGMIIHSGHGFIFSQWVSRRFNRRTDEYGGSMENRARFPILCLQRIRDAVGEDFIVEMRFSADESISPISGRKYLDDLVTVEETVAFFRELDKHPGLLDIAHISGGLHFVPYYNTRVIPNSFYPMAPNLEAAAKVKAAVKTIRVGCVGAMADPVLCEEAIASGKVDFVFLARQLCVADPEFPNKVRENRIDEIDNCLRCTVCKQNGSCAVNPVDVNRAEWNEGVRKAAVPKTVVVVGGGIAGMKAAEYACRAGHRVHLFEKENQLGGILRYSENDRFKTDIRRYFHAVARRLEAMDVTIHLGMEASPEIVAKEAPDVIIYAGGGMFNPLSIPVDVPERVMNSLECYRHPERTGRRVAVIGGGLTGAELAIFLGDQGKDVSLISRAETLMPRVRLAGPANGNPDTQRILLEKLRTKIYTGYSAVRITDSGIYVVNRDGDEVFIEADTVINTTGLSADASAAAPFESIAPTLICIGDCVKPAYIGDAVKAAYDAVEQIEDIRMK